jgi:hypothetical protein
MPGPAERLQRRRGELEQFDEGTELEEGEIYDRARAAAAGDADFAPF